MTGPSSHDPEQIVAYLDGELPDSEAETIEQMLAADPGLRTDMEHLTRSWDLLDLLPTGRASAGFSERTLSAIRAQSLSTIAEVPVEASVRKPPGSWKRSARQWSVRLLGLAGLLLLSMVSFEMTVRANRQQTDELLQELPLLERLHEYEDVGDVKFLRSLHELRLMDDGNATGRD